MNRLGNARGFTLLEMVVGLLIGGISILVGAHIAKVVIEQNAKGRERTDTSSKARLLGRQIRADVQMAAAGSSGAVAVNPGNDPWASMALTTPGGGFNAIPAITGANNVAATPVGGATVLEGSDVIQIVVPNPTRSARTSARAEAAASSLPFDPALSDPTVLNDADCGMLYVIDSSGPTGTGRSQLLFKGVVNANAVTTLDPLLFTVSPDSQVMCARLSSYWVDSDGWLHRSDFEFGVTPVGFPGSRAFINPNAVPQDRMAPGMLDLQVAYKMSSEIFAGAPPAPDDGWVFDGDATQLGEGALAGLGDIGWFEVRMVRINLLSRTLRRIQTDTASRDIARREDQAADSISVSFQYPAEWITLAEAATNLRYFDLSSSAGTAAEPY